jgi:serine/threonine protein kinase
MASPIEWKMERSLGEGGQAHTFVVRNPSTGDLAVLKRLKNLERLNRFEQEIQAIQSLSHPRLLRLISFDLKSAKPYFLSPYYPEGSLDKHSTLFERRPAEALRFLADVCDGLASAHSKGIVHRDIKPANILLADDLSPIVADFGICFVVDGERVTLTDEAVGPRLFLAPELEDGRTDLVSPRSDVYSLGKLLYWLVYPGRVFAREQHRADQWNLVNRHSVNHYEMINRLLDQMIAADPNARMANAAIVRDAARHVAGLIDKGARAMSPDLQQECAFCGQGVYRGVPMNSVTNVRNFGLEAVGAAKWRALVCDTCGHVQLFRIENIKAPNWWQKAAE